jgi:hypothetical protein
MASALALGVALATSLGACGTTAAATGTGARHTSLMNAAHSVFGTVTGTYQIEGGAIGPGGKQPGPRDLAGFIYATGAHGHARATVKDGRFTLRLRPGSYALTGWTPSVKEVSAANVVSKGSKCGEAGALVTAGHAAHAALYCLVP